MKNYKTMLFTFALPFADDDDFIPHAFINKRNCAKIILYKAARTF